MSSVRQIAKRVGVSVATVSRALNNHPEVHAATKAKILQAANRIGYSPTIGKRLTTVIGLVYPGDPVRPVYGDFESALLAGIMQGVNEQKFDIKLVSLERDKAANESYTQFFMRKGLRGVVIRSFEGTRRVCEEIAAERFPHIVVADHFETPGVNYVWSDSRADSQRAVQHLIQLGHRRIGLVVHAVHDTDHRDRVLGYQDALREGCIEFSDDLAVEIVANFEGGARAVNRLLSLPQPPSAIFFTDPIATLGGIRRCQELGVAIPGELSIIGFDDGDIRHHVYPAFTAVCQDARRLGFEAALRLTRSLAGQSGVKLRETFPTMFEINQTTGKKIDECVRILPDGSRVSGRRGRRRAE
jgi:DNA-binding LacI/PurR family transcriptional regulator